MHFVRTILQATAGAALGASLIGLAEAVYLIASSGAPDLLSPFYAVVLYGLFGAGFGIAGGVAAAVLGRFVKITDGRAWGIGMAAAITPLGLFILRYVVNKVVYAEQGVPMVGNLAILGAVGVVALFAAGVLPRLLDGPLKALTGAGGFVAGWGGLALATGVLALLPVGSSPRDGWAHGKPVPAALSGKPDVLVIMVDTLRADHVGAYGKMSIDTPAMDALAADGILFEQAFAQASWTRASGASLFTSRLPSGHNAALKASRLPDEVVTWSEVLQEGGVATGALINNINMTATFNFDQGFDTFLYEAPSYRYGATESVFGLAMYKVVHKLSERALGSYKEVERFYQPADVVLGDARGFIGANRDGRWGLFVHLMEPHDPFFEHPSVDGTGTADYNGIGFARAEREHPDPADVPYMKRVYAEEVVFMDRILADFFRWMKDEGLYDDTLIVLTSDHGEEFYEHGGFWHGTTLYDEQIHVPLVVKLPKGELAGTRVPWQVRMYDIAPTLTAALGLEADASWEGRDLVGDVRAEATRVAPAPEGDGVVDAEAEAAAPVEPDAEPDPCERRTHPLDRVVVAEEDFEGNQLWAMRAKGFKYARANEGNPRGLPVTSLFDVVADPGEQEDLVESGAAVCGRYPKDVAKAMDEEVDLIVAHAKQGAADGGTATIDAAECERLKALGYLSADEECGG